MLGFACCTLPCLALTLWVLGRGLCRPRSPGEELLPVLLARGVWLALAAMFVGIALFTGYRAQARIRPQRYVATIDARAKPLVAALDAYDRDHGAPPADLSLLVPRYLDAIPEPARGLGWSFSYRYVSCLTQPRWKLEVHLFSIDIDEDPGFYFDSWSRRFGYSPN